MNMNKIKLALCALILLLAVAPAVKAQQSVDPSGNCSPNAQFSAIQGPGGLFYCLDSGSSDGTTGKWVPFTMTENFFEQGRTQLVNFNGSNNAANTNAVYAPTSTAADAANLATILAAKTANYVVQYSAWGRGATRVALTAADLSYGDTFDIPNNGTNVTGTGGVVCNPNNVLLWNQNKLGSAYPWSQAGCGGNSQVVMTSASSGNWVGSVQTFTINPKFALQNPDIVDRLARAMAQGYMDKAINSAYGQFSSNAPAGIPGTTLTSATLGAALSAISGQSSVEPGTPMSIILGEEALFSLVYQASYTAGAAFNQTTWQGLLSSLWQRIAHTGGFATVGGTSVSNPLYTLEAGVVRSTGTSPVAQHGVAMTPSAVMVISAPAVGNVDPVTGVTVANGFALTSSAPKNGFVSTIRYSTSPTAANRFSFALDAFAAWGLWNNQHGVRIEY